MAWTSSNEGPQRVIPNGSPQIRAAGEAQKTRRGTTHAVDVRHASGGALCADAKHSVPVIAWIESRWACRRGCCARTTVSERGLSATTAVCTTYNICSTPMHARAHDI